MNREERRKYFIRLTKHISKMNEIISDLESKAITDTAIQRLTTYRKQIDQYCRLKKYIIHH